MVNFVRDLILYSGKTIIFVGALASFLLAIGYLAFPELLKKSDEVVGKMFDVEGWMMKNKQPVGLVFLAVTFLLFLVLVICR